MTECTLDREGRVQEAEWIKPRTAYEGFCHTIKFPYRKFGLVFIVVTYAQKLSLRSAKSIVFNNVSLS